MRRGLRSRQLILPRLGEDRLAGADLGVEARHRREAPSTDDESAPVLRILRVHVELRIRIVSWCHVSPFVHAQGAMRHARDPRPPADQEDVLLEWTRDGDCGVGDVLRQLVVQTPVAVHVDLHPQVIDGPIHPPALAPACLIDEMRGDDVFVDVDSNGHGVAFL